jgi:hypothetical protein
VTGEIRRKTRRAVPRGSWSKLLTTSDYAVIPPMNSYSINELYAFTPTVEPGTFERLNPLTEAGSLDEAELVDIRLAAQRLHVGIMTGVATVGWDISDSHLWGPHSRGARWGDSDRPKAGTPSNT